MARVLLLLAASVLGMAAASTDQAGAQGTPTTLVIPAWTFGATADSVGRIDVYGKGEDCGRIVFTDAGRTSAQEYVLQLDAPGKPAECATNGARLTFIDGRGHLLYRSLIVLAGQPNVLDMLPPSPPRDPDPSAFSDMIIVIPHQARERADTSLGIHFIDGYADGVFCARWPLRVDDGPVRLNGEAVLAFGKAGQPADCTRVGASLALLAVEREDQPPAKRRLLAELRLVRGATYLLTSFDPVVLSDQRDVLPPQVGTGLARHTGSSPQLPPGRALAAIGVAGLSVTRRGRARRSDAPTPGRRRHCAGYWVHANPGACRRGRDARWFHRHARS